MQILNDVETSSKMAAGARDCQNVTYLALRGGGLFAKGLRSSTTMSADKSKAWQRFPKRLNLHSANGVGDGLGVLHAEKSSVRLHQHQMFTRCCKIICLSRRGRKL